MMWKPLWASMWKSSKPKTLVFDPLSKALENLDAALRAWDNNQDDVTLMNVGKATKAAIKAAAATKAKASPVAHKQGIAKIGETEKDLNSLDKQVVRMEKDLQVYFTSVRKGIVGMRQVLVVFCKDPSPQRVGPALAAADKFSTDFNSLKPPFPLQGKEFSSIPSYFGMPLVMLKDLQKHYVKLKAATPGSSEAADLPRIQSDIKNVIKELEAQVKKGVNTAHVVNRGNLGSVG